MMALENWLLSRLGKSQLMDDLSTAGFGSYRGELLDFHLNDLIRQLKDNYIIFNGLCARHSVTLVENSDKPFVVVIAGGGYAKVSNLSESYPTARKFNELG